jgi:hypothetical protein
MGLIRRKKSKVPVSMFTGDYEIFEIRVPKEENDKFELRTAPIAAEHMFASLHGLLREDKGNQEHFSLEIVATAGGIKFYAVVPKNISSFVESQIYAQYPSSNITRVDDYVPASFKHGAYKVANLNLTKPDFFPLKTFMDFEIDPLSALTSALSETKPGEDVWFQLMVRPIPDGWQQEGYEYVASINEGTGTTSPVLARDLPKDVIGELKQLSSTFIAQLAGRLGEPGDYVSRGNPPRVFLTSAQDLELKSIESKLSKMGFEVVLRLLSHAETEERAENLLRSIIASTRQFSTAHLNSFSTSTRSNDPSRYEDYTNRSFVEENSFVLNIEELGSIYHLPSSSVETPGVTWAGSKKAEPPANLPTKDCTYIGTTVFRDNKVKFGLMNDNDDRVRHMYLIGKSGTGKSTAFKNMIMQDMVNGEGICVVDPHGELIDDILDYIPDDRVDDVVVVDPSDTDFPVGINLLELDDPSQKNLMASALVSSMKQYFWSWGPRLEYLLNYAVLTLLEVPGTSMLSITRLLTDMNYQNYILHFVKDPVVLDFWEEEYKAMRGNPRLITEAVAPIQNKINRFLSSTTIRNMVGQKNSTVDFWEIMNNKKILLMNLSKGKIGADNANLLGALLVSRLQFTAMQRVKIAANERLPFYLYVDEFQNFAGGDFESILSESRKYKLGLYLTHQYTSQLSEELLSAVFGNVGTIASFGLGSQDAKIMETEFAPYFDENDLIALPKFEMYMKLMVDGQSSRPFSAKIFQPWLPEEALAPKTGNREKVIQLSRDKYGADAENINNRIRKWVEYPFDKGKAVAEGFRQEAKAGGKQPDGESHNIEKSGSMDVKDSDDMV